MKERSILFSAPMVRAIGSNRKKVTRRMVKPQPVGAWAAPGKLACPYGQPGDRLVVKEATWIWCAKTPNGTTKSGRAKFRYVPLNRDAIYCADEPQKPAAVYIHPSHVWKYKPARFMPRWASRLSLEITGVRLEMLHEITEVGAIDEGVLTLGDEWVAQKFPIYEVARKATQKGAKPPLGPAPRARFEVLWIDLNGRDSWESNPWVWVVSFRRIT